MVGVGGIKNPHRPQAGRKSSLSLSLLCVTGAACERQCFESLTSGYMGAAIVFSVV